MRHFRDNIRKRSSGLDRGVIKFIPVAVSESGTFEYIAGSFAMAHFCISSDARLRIPTQKLCSQEVGGPATSRYARTYTNFWRGSVEKSMEMRRKPTLLAVNLKFPHFLRERPWSMFDLASFCHWGGKMAFGSV